MRLEKCLLQGASSAARIPSRKQLEAQAAELPGDTERFGSVLCFIAFHFVLVFFFFGFVIFALFHDVSKHQTDSLQCKHDAL